MEIKRLPSEIRHKKHGYDFKLIERIGKLAWYEARYIHGSTIRGYVVIRIRTKRGGRLPSGSVVSDYEEFPPESSFGGRGFFYMPKNRGIAEEKFKSLVAETKKVFALEINGNGSNDCESS